MASIILLENNFNELINSFIKNKVGISNHFLSDALAGHLKENLKKLYSENRLITAGTGPSSQVKFNALFRSDVIYWLDREHNDVHENNFFDLMDSFVIFLNQSCYTGITGYEFHYTLYEEGSFYKKHIDQFQGNNSRQFSMILYLNSDWIITDGGELCIHHQNTTEHISPTNGKAVFFKSSELAHEVLISHKQRMSITGWLKS